MAQKNNTQLETDEQAEALQKLAEDNDYDPEWTPELDAQFQEYLDRLGHVNE